MAFAHRARDRKTYEQGYAAAKAEFGGNLFRGYTSAEALKKAVEIGTLGAWEWLQAWVNANLSDDDPPPEDW